MIKIVRLVSVLVMTCTALPMLQAESPFDGTWRLNARESKMPPEPFAFSLDKGVYSCPTCANSWSVRADGTDQRLPGTDAMVKVTTVDARTIEITFKRSGKVYMKWTQTVSDDGNTLTMKSTLPVDNNSQPLVSEVTYARLEPCQPGAHAASGAWRDIKARGGERNRSFTYQTKGDEVTFSDTTGVSYHAKLDGTETPVKGGGVWTAVSLKGIDERTIQETEKHGALVSSVLTITVSPDGKRLRMVEKNPEETGQRFLLVADKQ